MDFITNKNILYKFQSGFRKFHSTDSRLSHLQDKVAKEFDSGLLTGMIFSDLQKAFDTIDHKILIKKMKCMGFLIMLQNGLNVICPKECLVYT